MATYPKLGARIQSSISEGIDSLFIYHGRQLTDDETRTIFLWVKQVFRQTLKYWAHSPERVYCTFDIPNDVYNISVFVHDITTLHCKVVKQDSHDRYSVVCPAENNS